MCFLVNVIFMVANEEILTGQLFYNLCNICGLHVSGILAYVFEIELEKIKVFIVNVNNSALLQF